MSTVIGEREAFSLPSFEQIPVLDGKETNSSFIAKAKRKERKLKLKER